MVNLVDYGIQNEESDVRAHVCPVARRVYVYPTTTGRAAVDSGRYKKVPGWQPGVNEPTAEGYLVPPFEIERCISLGVNDGVWERLGMAQAQDTSTKGRKALWLVKHMILAGLFPLPMIGTEVQEKDIQIRGADLIVAPRAGAERPFVVQVKCDYPGGEKALGGTGNLFLQVAESNPLGRY